jgi:RNA polymerase sigma-70 factor (ECF subfamily)
MEQRARMEQPKTHADLIDACQRGDRDSFKLLFETYKDKVFSIAVYSFHGDQTAASDVTQQVFLKLMTSISQFRGDSEFTTWLYRFVVNACIDEQRRRRRFLPISDAFASSRFEDRKPQEHQYARAEVATAVQQAIAELNAKFRLPILLRYIEGLSYEEIAAVLGCSKGTVASRLSRGHKALARRLSYLRE